MRNTVLCARNIHMYVIMMVNKVKVHHYESSTYFKLFIVIGCCYTNDIWVIQTILRRSLIPHVYKDEFLI